MAIVAKYSLNWNANALVWPNWVDSNVTWVDWKVNWAWSFNGSNSKIDLSITALTNFSFYCFFNKNWLGTEKAIFKLWNTADNQIMNLRINTSNKIFIDTYNWTTSKTTTTTETITTNKYYFVAITNNSWVFKIYLNGELLKTATLHNISYWWDKCSIWYQAVSNVFYFDWIIDECVLLNNTMSDTDIKNKYLFYNWLM